MLEQKTTFLVDISLEVLETAKSILLYRRSLDWTDEGSLFCKIRQSKKMRPFIFELNILAIGLNIANEKREDIFYEYYRRAPSLTWNREKVWVDYYTTIEDYSEWQDFILRIIDVLWGGLVEIELEELKNCLYSAFEKHDKKIIDALLATGGKLSNEAIEYLKEDGPSWFMQTKYKREIPEELKPYFYEAKLIEL